MFFILRLIFFSFHSIIEIENNRGEAKLMNICVYGASSNIIDNSYIDAGERLGEEMAKRGHSLVYGGGTHGLMGAVARGMSRENGNIIGVAPSFFEVDGVLYDKCTEFIYTETMRERKKIMEENSEAFIVTPGGIGTYEEFMEILTLKQLNRHQKAIAILNTNGYYDMMIELLKESVRQKFMRNETLELFETFGDCVELLDYFESYESKEVNIKETKHI